MRKILILMKKLKHCLKKLTNNRIFKIVPFTLIKVRHYFYSPPPPGNRGRLSL